MKKYTAAIILTAAAALALTGCGSGPAETAVANAPTPRPTVTITKTVTKPAPPAVTITTEVAFVPQVCLVALDNAEAGFDLSSQAMTAAGNFDVAALSAVTTKLQELSPTWNANKAACRTASN